MYHHFAQYGIVVECLHSRPQSPFRYSLFQALGRCGRSKKRAGDKRDQRRAGSGILFPYQTPLIARPLFQSSSLTESLEQAIFATLSRWGRGTRIEVPFDSRAKAVPARKSEKGYGDENGVFVVHKLIPKAFFTFQKGCHFLN